MNKNSTLSNNIVEHAEAYCDCCWVETLKDGHCELVLPDEPRALMSVDRRYRAMHREDDSDRLCDFMVFAERDARKVVAPCELKGVNPKIDHAHEQLQGGAEVAEEVLDGFPNPHFVPVLASRKTLDPVKRKHLAKLRVTFRGVAYAIRSARCGARVEDLIT